MVRFSARRFDADLTGDRLRFLQLRVTVPCLLIVFVVLGVTDKRLTSKTLTDYNDIVYKYWCIRSCCRSGKVC